MDFLQNRLNCGVRPEHSGAKLISILIPRLLKPHPGSHQFRIAQRRFVSRLKAGTLIDRESTERAPSNLFSRVLRKNAGRQSK